MIPSFDELADLGIGVIGHVLRAHLHDPLVFLGLLAELPGQVHLRPVRQRLLAIDVLAGANGVDGLRGVMAVGRGNAHRVNPRVGQQFLVVAVGFPPVFRAAASESRDDTRRTRLPARSGPRPSAC